MAGDVIVTTAMFTAYRIAMLAASPLLWGGLHVRASLGKEDKARLAERYGRSSSARPQGRLLWCHGASVGEALSALPLVNTFLEQASGWHVLFTTGTVTSAALLHKRLPEKAFHQYLPVDSPLWVRRFHRHWQPDAALWMESDLWPCHLQAMQQRSVPALLGNARLSARSFHRWKRSPQRAKRILQPFSTILAQDEQQAFHFRELGHHDVVVAGNMKWDAPPLPVDDAELETMRKQTFRRKLWLAASTHPGEEEQLANAARVLRRTYKKALLVMVPRHANRGLALAERLRTAHMEVACRSQNEAITDDTDIYIADTMGELGLWYRLCPLAFVGGSLVPHGGQNMLEPAALGCFPLWGPSVYNFHSIAPYLLDGRGGRQVTGIAALQTAIQRLWDEPKVLEDYRRQAVNAAARLQGATATTLARLYEMMHTHGL